MLIRRNYALHDSPVILNPPAPAGFHRLKQIEIKALQFKPATATPLIAPFSPQENYARI
jgi:hypothetical protein